MEFTYDGMVRYAYGFANPNHAAALLAILLPLFWYGRVYWRKKRFVLYFLIICELLIYAGIIMTYSRSGMLAVMVGSGVFYFLLQKKINLSLMPKLLSESSQNYINICLVVAFSGLFFLAIISGAGERSIKWLSSPDRSVTNRFAVWAGGLQMLSDNPNGVGAGQSGMIYSNFYQKPGNKNKYRTMVNSFLTFINEYGIFYWSVLFLLSATVIVSVVWLLHQRKTALQTKLQLTAFLTGFMIIFIVGSSSTCFDLSVINKISSLGRGDALNTFLQSVLLALPVILLLYAGMIIFRHHKLLAWRKIVLVSAVILMLTNALIVTGGMLLNSSRSYHCQVINDSRGNSYIKLTKCSVSKGIIAGFADEAIYPTDNFIELLKGYYPVSDMIIFLPQMNSESISDNLLKQSQAIVACGDDYFSDDKVIADKTILLFPQLPPGDSGYLPHKVILDRYDRYGQNIFWVQLLPDDRIAFINCN